MSVTVKLFAGYPLPFPLKVQLNDSIQWKNAKIDTSDLLRLLVIHHNDKEYLGRFLPGDTLDVEAVPALDAELQKKVLQYAPEADLSTLTLQFFPQLFIT